MDTNAWRQMPHEKSEDIIPLIDAFCDAWDEKYINPCYTFAHIVMDDYNILDGHIDFCLKEKTKWLRERRAGIARDRAEGEEWYQSCLSDLLEETNAICEFLQYLKQIPYEVRETFWDNMAFYECMNTKCELWQPLDDYEIITDCQPLGG